MMDLVIARLRATCMAPDGPLRLVDGAVEYAALDAPPPLAKMPAAYVVPLTSTPSDSNLVNAVRQRVEETIGVVLLASRLSDPRGAAAAITVDGAKDAVRAALVGWTPEPGWEPVLMGPAALLDFDQGVVAWRETFTSAFQLRGTP